MHTLTPELPTASGFLQIAATIGHAVVAGLGAVAARWRRHRQASRTATLLAGLDGSTLRDLGLTRAEAMSAAAAVHGLAEPTRVRELRSARAR